MRQGIFVPLLDEQREALCDLADREWRRPVEQAAKLLIEGLIREGALTDAKPTPAALTAAPVAM